MKSKSILQSFFKSSLLLLLFYSNQLYISAQGPIINKIEYFLDTDPGYNNATSLSFANSNNVSTSFNINLIPLNAGVHIIGVRSKDVNGAWSLDNKWIFLKPYPNSGAAVQPNITKVEWYIDNDPGYGNATPISITAGQDVSGLSINLNLVPLQQGVHIVGIRSLDANGAWSLDNKWIFLKPYTNAGAIPQPNITRVEWFLDTDPGFGNATAIPIVPGQDISGLAINISLIPLNQGVHIVGIRSLDANGAWSFDNKWIFLKPYTNAGAIPQPNITRVEWFLDTDPGFGNATAIPIVPGQDISGLAINISLIPLNQGVHIVGIRSLDANGAWSFDNKWIFLKPYTNAGAIPQPNITRVEWFLDTDPGFGNATAIPITPGQNLSGLSINIDLMPLRQGVHIVGLRSQDANGAWSLDNKWIFLKPYAGASSIPQPKIVKVEYFIDSDPGYGKGTAVIITSATDISSIIFNADISVVPNGAHKLGIRSLDEYGAWSLDNKLDFTGGTLVSNTYRWIGNSSTDWTNAVNWSSGIVPTATNDVLIPSGTPFSPVIATGILANCKSIQINPGAIITIATGGNLKVNQ